MNYLDKTITIKSIIEWKLHWLYCDIAHSKEKENLTQKESSINAAIQLLQQSHNKFYTLLWEMKIIADADCRQDIQNELKSLEKYIQYENEYNALRGKILELYRKSQDTQFKVVSGSINDLL